MNKNKREQPQTPEICPVCGEEVPRGALACPECGADHKSGWRADADIEDAVGEADSDFDYDEFVRKEFGSSIRPAGMKTLWWITALFLIAAIALLYLYSR